MGKEQDYDALGEMLIRREEAKLERSRAKAKALEKNMAETIAELFKQQSVKRVIAKDAMAATNDSSRRDKIFEKANTGMYDNDREVITGHEPRPWEQ